MQKPYTFIFVGRSGSGKGTQIKLLQEYIQKNLGGTILSFDMGAMFRAFFSESGYFPARVKESINSGKFQPDFITDALFVTNAMKVFDGTSHLFFDGYPRGIGQLKVIKELLSYANYENPVVINVEVSRESVKSRLVSRGRADDSESAIDSRLNEFERTVVPMLEVIKSDSTVKYIQVDGEPTIEEIHKDIINKLGI